MEYHPLDKVRIDADTAASEALADLPAARVAEVALAKGLGPDDPRPTIAEAVAWLDEHEPSEDGPLSRGYARVIAAQAAQHEAHAAWRDYLFSQHDN